MCRAFVVLGLSQAAESGGSSLVAVHGLLIAVASLAEHRPESVGSVVAAYRLHCSTARGILLDSDPLGLGIERMSPALTGGLPSTTPPGKSWFSVSIQQYPLKVLLPYIIIGRYSV